MLIGGGNRTCTVKGFWSGQAPTCKCKINVPAQVCLPELALKSVFTVTALVFVEQRSGTDTKQKCKRRSGRAPHRVTILYYRYHTLRLWW
jgi:hypothetical protein